MLIVDFIESLIADKKTMIQESKKMVCSIVDAHERIYDAIVKRDENRASEEMRRHIIDIEKYMVKLVKKDPVVKKGI